MTDDIEKPFKDKNFLDRLGSIFSFSDSTTPTMANTPQAMSSMQVKNIPPVEIQSTEDDSDSRFLMSLIGQGIASLGAGIRGGDVGQVARQFNYMRDLQARQDERRKLQEEQKKQIAEITNPQSPSSISKRKLYSKVMGINIPDDISASDLSDSFVLQGLRDRAVSKPVGGVGGVRGGVAKPKEEKPFKFEEIDIKENSAINELRNLTNALSQSVKNYGNPLYGAEEKNQNTLKYGIAATMGVLKGQGAMTEPDIEFWNKNLKSSFFESPEEYSNRLNKLQENLIKKRINALESRGLEVEYDENSNQYFIFKGNDKTVLGKF
jgi:hypothetical protein